MYIRVLIAELWIIMEYVYCIFCETRRCRAVADKLQEKVVDIAFSPQIVKRQRKAGKNIDMLYDLLPGYVFAYSKKELPSISVLRVDGVIRILGSSDNGYCLSGADKDFANGLLEREGRIDVMKVIHVGDTVFLEDELFPGQRGRILEIDYRKQRAKIEFSFMNTTCYSWVACDVISRTL